MMNECKRPMGWMKVMGNKVIKKNCCPSCLSFIKYGHNCSCGQMIKWDKK